MAEQSLSLSPYQFGYNNPAYYSDPTGALSQAEFENIVNIFLGSQDGGYWSESGGGGSGGGSVEYGGGTMNLFGSSDEAFGYGAAQMSQNHSWGGGPGWATSFDNALGRYGGSISPGMVQGYYQQRWSGNGRYDINAGYAGGVHAGRGFSVGYSFDVGSGAYENTLETVGVGGLYVSYEGMMDLFRGKDRSDGASKLFTISTYLSVPFAVQEKAMNTIDHLTPNVSAFKSLGRIAMVGGKVLGGLSALSSTYKFIQNPTWATGLRATWDVGLLFLAPEFSIGDAIFDATGLKDKVFDGVSNMLDQ